MTPSALHPDWSREKCRGFWDPGRKLLRCIRRYQAVSEESGIVAWLARKYWALEHRFWSVVTGSEIHLLTDIAGGLLLPHPVGIIVHPDARIGPNCLLFHHVTLGVGDETGAVPILGGHVDIGAGAKILGSVRIGDHARIGANAVVLSDVPAGATAVGVPAKVIPGDVSS